MRDACLLLFTKPARAGQVKTRLITPPGDKREAGLTAERAAELHQAFLEDLTVRLAAGSFDLKLAWAVEDGQPAPVSDLPATLQKGGDLGDRLFDALSVATRDHAYAAAVGSDHPELPLAAVERGFSRLRDGVEVVLGPAEDGGYYYVGARADSLRPEIFSDIDWSTHSVLETTLKRCRDLPLTVELLELGRDIDTPADLERLVRRLDRKGTEVDCPSTERLLRSWGLLAAGRLPA